MEAPSTPRAVFECLVQAVADLRVDDCVAVYAEDAVVDHPFDPGGAPPLVGRAQLRAHFADAAARLTHVRFRPRVHHVHHTSDPEVIVAEFDYHGHVTATGSAFTAPNVFVLRIRDGLIVESRDYARHDRIPRDDAAE